MKKNKIKNNFFTIIFLFIVILLWLPNLAPAEEITQDKNSDAQIVDAAESVDENVTPLQKFKNYFSADLRILSYGVVQEYAKVSYNPDNNFFQIPHYIANLEIRPELRMDTSFLEISVKPRAILNFKEWEEGIREEDTKWKDDCYINEWLVRLNAWNRIFVSYERENLQWGPSFLFSPSNPFFTDNGRSNPTLEISGKDFVRLMFIPHKLWTISLIVNTDKGRNTLIGYDSFEETYAVKIDYTGRGHYVSLIVSRKDDRNTLGFFGGWTVSDALMLYSEGSMQKGSDALYPQKDASPLGVSMRKIYQDDGDVKPIILTGASYTFENCGMLTLEYTYNSPGYNGEEADLFYTLGKNAAAAFNSVGATSSLGQSISSQAVNALSPGLRLWRKNYAMLQYFQGNIKNSFNMTLRWTQNIDDGSGQFLTYLSYSMGNHWELFSFGLVNSGKECTEFGSILNYQVMFGLKFTL